MPDPEPDYDKPLLPLLYGIGCSVACMILLWFAYTAYANWSISVALNSGPSSLGATESLTPEQIDAEEREDAHYEALVRRNFKVHEHEFNTLAKRLMAVYPLFP